MKINFFKRSNSKITAVGFIVASVVLIWQVYDIYPEIDVVQNDIKSQEAINKDIEKTLQKVKDFTGFVQGNKEIMNKFDLILPDDIEKANLFSTLDRMATSNNLISMRINFEKKIKEKDKGQDTPTTNTEGYDFIPANITMSLRGSYSSFNNFLIAIEKNLRLMEVISVDFLADVSPGSKEIESKTYSFNIILKTYFKNPLKEKNIANLLGDEKFKNFTIENLNFTKEKMFEDLSLSPDYNINIKEDEIGKQYLF